MLTYVKKARLKTANGNAKTAYNAVAEYVADELVFGQYPGAISWESCKAQAGEDGKSGSAYAWGTYVKPAKATT